MFASYRIRRQLLTRIFIYSRSILTSKSFVRPETHCSLKRNWCTSSTMKIQYPNPRRDESIVDSYHLVQVPDPYRWMEDPDNEETKKFVDEQNAITMPFLEKCQYRKEIHDRLTQVWDYPKYSCPFRRGNKYFFSKNSGLQNQSVLYIQDTLESEPQVFLDPNTLSEDGTIALTTKAFSEDDQIFAYGLSACGSDWFTVHFKHVEKGDIYEDKLEKLKFTGLSWTHDSKGLFYGCYKDQEGKTDGSETSLNLNHKLFYHTLGTPQSKDVIVVEFTDNPEYIIGSEVSDCGNYLIVTPSKATQDNLIYFSNISEVDEIGGLLELVPVVTEFEADYEYIVNTDSEFIFRTNKDAPNFKLIIIDFNKPDRNNWKTLISEHERDVLEWAHPVNENYLVICFIRDVKNVMQLHCMKTGKLIYTFPLELGTITGFKGRRKYKDIFYQFSSFLTPGITYYCDLSQPMIEPKMIRDSEIKNFDRDKYTAEQVFYTSKDGTKVPMFIVHRKDMVMNANNPCLLYGYGGFNVSLLPSFSITKLVFLDNMHGIYAVPNIRGGGEYGKQWHKAGTKENKQNVFDDFHAAAEYLINEKYTNSKLLAINGGSNGGLLVAACANQRPDLYGAAIANVGVLDMLRFQKFTIGHFWVADYGSSDNETDFKALHKYSPLHNIRVPENCNIQYPATLLLSADHDDRVVPLHSLKFIAELQNTFRSVPNQTNPLLIRIDTKAGHGAGKPTTKVIQEWTDIFCFLIETMGLELTLPSSNL